MPLGERTVQRWLLLADLAEAHPEDLRRFAHLGPTKLYLIATLPPGPRGKLKARSPIRARARDVDPGLASELVAELYGLAEALEATFDL